MDWNVNFLDLCRIGCPWIDVNLTENSNHFFIWGCKATSGGLIGLFTRDRTGEDFKQQQQMQFTMAEKQPQLLSMWKNSINSKSNCGKCPFLVKSKPQNESLILN